MQYCKIKNYVYDWVKFIEMCGKNMCESVLKLDPNSHRAFRINDSA